MEEEKLVPLTLPDQLPVAPLFPSTPSQSPFSVNQVGPY